MNLFNDVTFTCKVYNARIVHILVTIIRYVKYWFLIDNHSIVKALVVESFVKSTLETNKMYYYG